MGFGVTRARNAWLVSDCGRPLALVDVEVYERGAATIALCVAPAQSGRGYGKRVVESVLRRAEFAGLTFELGVEPDNLPSIAICRSLGGELIGDGPDHQGMLNFRLSTPAVPAS
jgi:RimJ/RimL family protein N-acetyltransferase